MTLANRITFFRLALIPVFCGLIVLYTPEQQELRWWALIVFLTAAISDGVDGWIARHFHQQTELGARLDPLADKLLVNLGFVLVAANDAFQPGIPLWYPVLVLGRDFVIVMGALAIQRLTGELKHVQPRLLGKLSTVGQLGYMLAILAALPFADYLLWFSVLVIAASCVDYAVTGIRQGIARGKKIES